ncbi:MAG: hypothetical protein E7000_07405 [Coriobacteriaceae bacterium]|nr:hypothetical protein [Coriobacteriaceae bacterium]
MSGEVSKPRLLLVWAFVAALCLALAGCGGSGSSAASSSGGSESGSASESSTAPEPADPSEKFIGDWKIAAVNTQGMLVVGDFSANFESAADMKLSVKEDGTGSLSLNDESRSFTWKLANDDAISLEVEDVDDPLTVNYADEALTLEMNTDDMAGTMYFTKDGAYAGGKALALADATDITSPDAVTGTWTMCGAGLSGMTMYGDAEALSALGIGDSTTLVLNEDGSAEAFGTQTTWTAGADGATVNMSFYGSEGAIPMKMIDDYLIIDASEAMNAEMFFLYKK